MTRTFLTSVAALSLSAAISSAQSGSTANQNSAGAPPTGPVTISGCIERADQLVQSGASTLGADLGSQDFALIKASGTAVDDKAPVGTSGTSATKGPSSVGHIFMLDGKDEMLNPHVGHEVEIVGTMVPLPHVEVNTAVPARAPVVRVQSVKMIESSCTR